MLVVLAGQAVAVQRLANVGLDPVGGLGLPLFPALEPRLEVLLRFFEIAPVVEPAELLATVVVVATPCATLVGLNRPGFPGELVT